MATVNIFHTATSPVTVAAAIAGSLVSSTATLDTAPINTARLEEKKETLQSIALSGIFELPSSGSLGMLVTFHGGSGAVASGTWSLKGPAGTGSRTTISIERLG